jgi:hypothetical protein
MAAGTSAVTSGSDPELLGAFGLRVRRELVAQFGSAPQVKRIAEQAARFLELADQARAVVAREGLVIETAKGTFRHPAIEVERTMRVSYLQAVRLLESPRRGKVGRPPMGEGLPGTRGAAVGVASRFFKSRRPV